VQVTQDLETLQVVTFLHVEMQSILQLFQVPGLLQDTLALAKSLQAACFPIMVVLLNHTDAPGMEMDAQEV